jgi:apolipoprotein D and lipocalin family protein
MKPTIKMILSMLLLPAFCISCKPPTTLASVPEVDLDRYSGTWYELASYPKFFERGCINVRATYTPKDGYIEVHNECIKNGKPTDIKGKAFVVENSGNAKLKVQFFWPFKGDYWIIDLADDYSWAVVSDPRRETLWILSRTPKMDEMLYNSLINKLVDNEFERNKIVKMVQE